MTNRTLGLFEATGIEIEYMIVDASTLDVRPITDELLKSVAGSYEMSVDRGPIAWSNELVLHVVELKTNGPVTGLGGVAAAFQESVSEINARLDSMGARLMPTAMHPWMNPAEEFRIWPHEDREIYARFDEIFDCRRHGWANLQSVHVNLPFDGDEEFVRLHAAIRMVLPLLAGLAASSPYADGVRTEFLDTRLDVYRNNAALIPSICGRVIPEAVGGREEYEAVILAPIYRDLAPYDTDGTLCDEWANARGAIARFDRDAIEIRVLDTQECPVADLAVVALVRSLIESLVNEASCTFEEQLHWPIDGLVELFHLTNREAERARVGEVAYLRALGVHEAEATVADVWRAAFESATRAGRLDAEYQDALRVILDRGPLARRIAAAAGGSPDRGKLRAIYGRLCDCLRDARMFLP